MIGANTLLLNQATMKKAVQEYLNRRALSTGQVEVTSVAQPQQAFIVWVKPLEESKVKAK